MQEVEEDWHVVVEHFWAPGAAAAADDDDDDDDVVVVVVVGAVADNDVFLPGLADAACTDHVGLDLEEYLLQQRRVS